MKNISTRHILFEKAPIKIYTTKSSVVLEGFLNKNEYGESIFFPTNINLIVRPVTKGEYEYELERFFYETIKRNNLYTNILHLVEQNKFYYLDYKKWYKVIEFGKKEAPRN
jgi:hypothetical protein